MLSFLLSPITHARKETTPCLPQEPTPLEKRLETHNAVKEKSRVGMIKRPKFYIYDYISTTIYTHTHTHTHTSLDIYHRVSRNLSFSCEQGEKCSRDQAGIIGHPKTIRDNGNLNVAPYDTNIKMHSHPH